MMSSFRSSSLREWIQQPTTLIGMAVTIGGLAGVWTGSLHEAAAYTLFSAAIPLLIPDNTTAQRSISTLLPTLLDAMMERHSHAAPSVSQPEHPPAERKKQRDA